MNYGLPRRLHCFWEIFDIHNFHLNEYSFFSMYKSTIFLVVATYTMLWSVFICTRLIILKPDFFVIYIISFIQGMSVKVRQSLNAKRLLFKKRLFRSYKLNNYFPTIFISWGWPIIERWAKDESGPAPCQCSSCGGIKMTVPGVTVYSLSLVATIPLPSVT